MLEVRNINLIKDSMKVLDEYIRIEGYHKNHNYYIYVKEEWLNDIPNKDHMKLSEIPGLLYHNYKVYLFKCDIDDLKIDSNIPQADAYILFY